jgi:hypothetical protein
MSPGHAPNESMIDFAAVIRHFWPKALRTIEKWEDFKKDGAALSSLAAKDLDPAKRQEAVSNWLRSWAVFIGISAPQRVRITDAVIAWADARDPQRELLTADALAMAHAEFTDAIRRAWLECGNGKKRDFCVLVSKALWLCYPESVPICDDYAESALYIVAKLDGLTCISHKKPRYEQFVHIWKQLYAKYEDTIQSLDLGDYPYRVRVFDRILWLVGQPYYSAE